jgi:hypothetical protein
VSRYELAPTPMLGGVLRAQILATGAALRREAAVGGAILGALLVLITSNYYFGDGASFDFNVSEMTVPIIILGLFAPMAVWKGEEPSRRSYFWTLPVDRRYHTLVKAFSGWFWFMALVLGYVAWGAALALITDGAIGVEESIVPLPALEQGSPSGPSDYLVHRLEAPAWMWLVPFTAGTVTYLIGAGVVLVTDHAWRWFAAVIFGYLLITAFAQAGQAGEVGRLVGSVTDGRFGLEVLLTGVSNHTVILDAPGGGSATRQIDLPNQRDWALATLLWGGAGLLGVLVGAFRFQER